MKLTLILARSKATESDCCNNGSVVTADMIRPEILRSFVMKSKSRVESNRTSHIQFESTHLQTWDLSRFEKSDPMVLVFKISSTRIAHLPSFVMSFIFCTISCFKDT